MSRQRIRTLDVDVNKKWFEPDAIKQTGCPVLSEKDVGEDELHFIHSCEAYTTVSHNLVCLQTSIKERRKSTDSKK